MRTLAISPDEESYQLAVGPDSIAVDYGGGASATRRGLWGEPSAIQVQWTLSAWGYSYLMAFYRLTGAGAEAFLVDLVVGESGAVQCKARLTPDSLNLNAVSGDAHIVRAELQAQPPLYDAAADQATIGSFVPPY